MKNNTPMNTLKPQLGQTNSYNPKFHPLPGPWAQQQIAGTQQHLNNRSDTSGRSSPTTSGSQTSSSTEIQKALASERAQHQYWEEWQGVIPGKAVYENPRELQNTLLPSAKYGTEGRGYG